MLLNLSNHPSDKWSREQREAAEREFGAVVDLPFPQLNPTDSLDSIKRTVNEYIHKCLDILAHQHPQSPTPDPKSSIANAIHIMGEFTFTYLFVQEMEKRSVPCVASTTERIVTDNPDGSKTTVFRFAQFRPYFHT